MKRVICFIMLLVTAYLVEGQDLDQYNSNAYSSDLNQYNSNAYSSSQVEEEMHGKFIGDYVAQNQSGQSRSVRVYQRSDGYYIETRGSNGAYYAYFTKPGMLCTNIQGELWCFYL